MLAKELLYVYNGIEKRIIMKKVEIFILRNPNASLKRLFMGNRKRIAGTIIMPSLTRQLVIMLNSILSLIIKIRYTTAIWTKIMVRNNQFAFLLFILLYTLHSLNPPNRLLCYRYLTSFEQMPHSTFELILTHLHLPADYLR